MKRTGTRVHLATRSTQRTPSGKPEINMKMTGWIIPGHTMKNFGQMSKAGWQNEDVRVTGYQQEGLFKFPRDDWNLPANLWNVFMARIEGRHEEPVSGGRHEEDFNNTTWRLEDSRVGDWTSMCRRLGNTV